MHVPIDYDTLRVIWWALLGILLIGFAVFDGFDLGTAILLPFLGRSDMERRILINSIGPVWEGNQVWFILGGGASFAAWPPVYAASFSGFYVAMFVTLLALILRPVAFKFRGKVDNALWRSVWDWALFFGGLAPALIFGVAFGNLLQGVPFRFDAELRAVYTGGFFQLLNPFALLCGLVSVAMLVMHGAAYVQAKTIEPIAGRARRAGMIASIATLALFALGGVYAYSLLDGYAITSQIAANAPSNPLRKTVEVATGAWMRNYERLPWSPAAPLLGLVGALLAAMMFALRREVAAFVMSAASVVGIVATPGLAMFPFIMPSSSEPNASLTAWDASSSHLTLYVMLIAVVVFLPIVLAYTAWVYRVLRGKVPSHIFEPGGHAY
ncbi:cytochrome d ubiquinol oxidase subunit II [Methylocystis sp. JR02]|uniref:cytochrome d ubiquinol oxidase subunit II n=1 Tax=Methylocystis sp. JR02 TaxID=3046284 RepID=UPI0024B89C5A|nr:cytochrome d ubiquinol oxidase subunit II [Methylocystis sp. JR02]MDJ0450106.1 cytochrome d ubiquinol oxidase subunit II [Methylocystis sp. JR02]